MRAGHADQIARLVCEVGREHTRAVPGDIRAQLFCGRYRILRGGLTVLRKQAGGRGCKAGLLLPAVRAEQPFRHRGAAGVARADKNNLVHIAILPTRLWRVIQTAESGQTALGIKTKDMRLGFDTSTEQSFACRNFAQFRPHPRHARCSPSRWNLYGSIEIILSRTSCVPPWLRPRAARPSGTQPPFPP